MGISLDHKNLLGFLLAFFYLKGCNSFDDFEWKLFMEGAVAFESTLFLTDRAQVLFLLILNY